MAHLVIVGSDECPITKVCNVLMGGEKTPLDLATLPTLSEKLGVSEIQATTFKAVAGLATHYTLLHEILVKWHSYKSTGATLDVLCNELKAPPLKMLTLAVALEKEFVKTKEESKPGDAVDTGEDELDFGNIEEPLTVIVTIPSDPDLQAKQKPEDDKKGYAFILNIKAFLEPGKNRVGSEHDVGYMTELWTELGYTIYPKKNDRNEGKKTAEDVERLVKEFKKKCIENTAKSIVIFVGSHGAYQKISTSDGKEVDLYDDILNPFTSKACSKCCEPDPNADQACTCWLHKIPKMFFVNSCQDFQDRAPQLHADGDIRPNAEYHMALMVSQLPGESSYRGEKFGSLFTYALTEVFMKNAHNTDAWKMMGMVAKRLSRAKGPEEYRQIAVPYFHGLEELYFTLD